MAIPADAAIMDVAVQSSIRRGIALTLAASAALVSCEPIREALARGPSLQDYEETLRLAAGAGARDCGVVALPASRAAAVSCARTALQSGEPFFVAFQVQGVDSTIYRGVVRPLPGRAIVLTWDSDVTGGSSLAAQRRIFSRDCPGPAVLETDDGGPIGCAEDRSAPDR